MAYICQQVERDKMAPNVEGFALPSRILIIVVCVAGWLLAAEGADTSIIGGETRVIDGDTLEVKGKRVRLQGIDAPEKGQLCENALGNLCLCGRTAIRALRERISATVTSRAPLMRSATAMGGPWGCAPCAAGT